MASTSSAIGVGHGDGEGDAMMMRMPHLMHMMVVVDLVGVEGHPQSHGGNVPRHIVNLERVRRSR